jgi:hypothetical protein
VNTILSEGTSADRQLAAYKNGGDARAVVELLAAETIGDPAGMREKTG